MRSRRVGTALKSTDGGATGSTWGSESPHTWSHRDHPNDPNPVYVAAGGPLWGPGGWGGDCSRRRMVGRRGRTRSRSMPTPASPISRWIRRTPTSCTRRRFNESVVRTAMWAAVRRAVSGRPPTARRRGRDSPRASPPHRSGGSASMCAGRSRRPCTRWPRGAKRVCTGPMMRVRAGGVRATWRRSRGSSARSAATRRIPRRSSTSV